MPEPEDMPTPTDKASGALFVPAWPQYNRPARIVTLGHYYPQTQVAPTNQLLRETRADYRTAASIDAKAIRHNLGWTQLINALNTERQWPLKRLFAMLDPMLEQDIAITVVPTHIAYQAFWPTRTLARQLAAHGRVDATSCLVRHTTVRRITFGGPSTRALHRQTIRVENPHLIAGKPVLLLDDIAKSGASLAACREMLAEAGAMVVQAMALGRVILGEIESG
jgi:phosphoribosylpyrophosphate synthetase